MVPPALAGQFPKQFISQVFSSRYTNYFAVGSLTVLLADYIQTLDLEVALIWPAKWNMVKVVYFMNRYLPLLFLPGIIFYNVAPPVSPEACKILFFVPSMGIGFCLLISEVILYTRVYALSGKTRPMVIFLFAHGGAVILTCLILFAAYLSSGKYVPSPDPHLASCFGVSSGNRNLILACFTIILYSGVLTTSLCIWFGLKMYWITRQSALVQIFYRDGTFFFVLLTVLSLTNGLVTLLAPSKYRFMVAIPQEVMHNVLTSRMILHLREHAAARMDWGFTTGDIGADGGTVISANFHATANGTIDGGSNTNSAGTGAGRRGRRVGGPGGGLALRSVDVSKIEVDVEHGIINKV